MEAPSFNEFSQHAQILGVLTGLLSGKRGYNALNNMLSDKSTISCSLPWQYYLFRALERFGMYKEMRQRLDDFTKLQDFNFTTMPEWGFEGSRSDCHAWSAVPLYEITATILGVRPAEDGWNKILVQPNLLGYSDCKGDVITPHGVVHIEITATDYSTTLKLQTPHETIVVMPDARRYEICADMFERLGVKEVKLLTNNPTKVEEMQKYHINVVERVPLEVGRNKYNNDYLNTKEIRMGHLLGHQPD